MNPQQEQTKDKMETVDQTELQLLAKLDSIRNNTYDLGLSPNKRRSWFKSYLKNANAAGIHLTAKHSYSEQEVRDIIEIVKNRCEVMLAHGNRFSTKQDCYDHNRNVILSMQTDDLLKKQSTIFP